MQLVRGDEVDFAPWLEKLLIPNSERYARGAGRDATRTGLRGVIPTHFVRFGFVHEAIQTVGTNTTLTEPACGNGALINGAAGKTV
jgi:hypothetical protein